VNKGGIGLILAGLATLILLKGDNPKPEPDAVPDEVLNNADVTPMTGDPVFMSSSPEQNVKAFLYMIQSSEHVYPRDVVSGAAYSTFYGGSRFYDLSDHPVNTGEKKGVRLPDAMCKASGFSPGCVSTGAGAYGFIKPTWDRIRAISPRLPDFSPASQDEAAVRLLDQIGALRLIEAGDIAAAVAKSSKTWASLPGSKAQQNPRQIAFVIDRFNEGLA